MTGLKTLFFAVLICSALMIVVLLFDDSVPEIGEAKDIDSPSQSSPTDSDPLTVVGPKFVNAVETERQRIPSPPGSPASALESPTSRPFVIVGTVRYLIHKPVDHALVRIGVLKKTPVSPSDGVWRELASTVTDAAGQFRFDGLDRTRLMEETLLITAQHDPFDYGELRVGPGLLPSGDVRPQIVVGPAGGLRGVVVDLRGRPIPAATIQFDSSRRFTCRTGADGRFDTGPIPFGGITVRASADGYAVSRGESVRILAGRTTQHRFRLEDGATLAGAVSDPWGRPLPVATLRVQGESGLRAVDEFGRFEFRDVRLGRTTVTVSAPGFQSEVVRDLTAPQSAIAVTLRSAWVVEGVVVAADDSPNPLTTRLSVEWNPALQEHWTDLGTHSVEMISSAVAWGTHRTVSGQYPDWTIGPEIEPALDARPKQIQFAETQPETRSLVLDPGGRFRCYGSLPGVVLVVAKRSSRQYAVGGPLVVGPRHSRNELQIEIPRTTDLSVHVREATTQRPIRDAIVTFGTRTAAHAKNPRTRSDDAGLAHIGSVPARAAFIHVARQGFENATLFWDGRPGTPNPVEVELRPFSVAPAARKDHR